MKNYYLKKNGKQLHSFTTMISLKNKQKLFLFAFIKLKNDYQLLLVFILLVIIMYSEIYIYSKFNNLKVSMKKFSQVKLSDDFIVNMGTVLGKGSTGCVYQGKNVRNGEKVAVKVIQLDTIDNQVTQYLLKMQKTAIMILESPYVLKGLRVMQDDKYCFMVTEYCNGGTLKNYIKQKGFLSQQKSFQIIQSLLEGYQKLVDKQIVHRDLKPANIMMHNDNPKIIDFGYCQITGYTKPQLQYNVGSPSYMAPQSLQSNIYNQKTEIWSFGVILFQCLTGKTLDEGQKMTQTFNIIQRYGVPYPDHISTYSRQIIDWCLNFNPRKRPNCSQLLSRLTQHKLNYLRTLSKVSFKDNFVTQKSGNQCGQKIQTLKSQPSSIFFENQSLDNVNKNNILQNHKIFADRKNIQTTRTQGVLTNQTQQNMNKYTENRMRGAFSTYEGQKTPPWRNLQPENVYADPQFQNNLNRKGSSLAENFYLEQYGLKKQNFGGAQYMKTIINEIQFGNSVQTRTSQIQNKLPQRNSLNYEKGNFNDYNNKNILVNSAYLQTTVQSSQLYRQRMASFRY